MTSLLSLPLEICAAICEQVSRTSLCALCRISPIFLGQAQRILYHTVDLQDCNARLVKSWCLAVTRHHALAGRVHSLSLQLPDNIEPTYAQKLSRALALCVNITHLSVLHDPDFPAERSVQSWILEECAFRLTHFRNSYFSSLGFDGRFFEDQSELRLLSLPYAICAPCSDTQLRNLVALDAPLHLVVSIPARPLERIQLHCERSEFETGLSKLSRYAPTLRTLIVVREGVEWGSPTVDIVLKVAEALPALSHFGINEHEKLHSFFSMEESPIRGLAQFTCIETFTFRIRRGIYFWESMAENTAYNVGMRDDLAAFGRAMLDACPSLRQVVVGGEATANTELKCTLRRSPEGSIQSEDGNELDFDAEATFWS